MLAGVSSLLPYTHTGIAPYNRMAHDRTGVYIVLFHQSGAMDDVIPIQRRSLEDLFYYLSKVISAQIRPSQPNIQTNLDPKNIQQQKSMDKGRCS